MTFFTARDLGRIYVIRMELPDDTVIHKIGITHTPRATDRLMAVLRSWFTRFRFVPYSELRLDLACENPKKLESYLHWILQNNRFEPNYEVEGHTEMFIGVNEIRLICFIRAYVASSYVVPPLLTEEGRIVLNKLLAPDED